MYLRKYIHIHKYSRTTNHKKVINFERDRRKCGSVFEGRKIREKSWNHHIISKKPKEIILKLYLNNEYFDFIICTMNFNINIL